MSQETDSYWQSPSLDPQKKPQENSYRIFYSLKYIPYAHSTCRIYSLLVPGILESRMSHRRLPVIGKVRHLILRKSPKRTATGFSTASNISRIPIRHAGSTACYSGNIGILDEPGDCQLLAKSLFEGEIVPKLSPVLSKAPEQGSA